MDSIELNGVTFRKGDIISLAGIKSITRHKYEILGMNSSDFLVKSGIRPFWTTSMDCNSANKFEVVKSVKLTETSQSKYPLGSKWKKASTGEYLTLVKCDNAPYDRRKDYLNPKRIGLIIDAHKNSRTHNPYWTTFTVADPNNITDAEWMKIEDETFVRVDKNLPPIKKAPLTKNMSSTEIKSTNRVSKSPLCVKCQANPLRRNCGCLGPMVPREKKKPKMFVRKGWDNIAINYAERKAYLHADSQTILFRRKGAWHWKGEFFPGGEQQFLINAADDPSTIMKVVEEILDRSLKAYARRCH